MADEFICGDCGYSSPDLANLKVCPVCGGVIVGTYEDIEKFETKYPDELVDEMEDDDLLDVEGEISLDEDLEEVIQPARKGKTAGRVRGKVTKMDEQDTDELE